MYPLARTDKLSVQEMAQETMICDLDRNKYHCLNRTASLVWRHCDGRHSVADLAQLLHAEMNLPADENIVRLALEQLERRQLLKQPLQPVEDFRRRGRRDLLKKLAVAAAALPVVMSATAKPAMAQISTRAFAPSPETPAGQAANDSCAGKNSGSTIACANFCASVGVAGSGIGCRNGVCRCG